MQVASSSWATAEPAPPYIPRISSCLPLRLVSDAALFPVSRGKKSHAAGGVESGLTDQCALIWLSGKGVMQQHAS